jgi:phenylacetate-CoA ligase
MATACTAISRGEWLKHRTCNKEPGAIMNALLDKLYAISPVFVQNLFVTAYGYKLYRREYGQKFEDILKQFEEIQWLSLKEIEAWQSVRLNRIIEHAFTTVPYYKRIMDDRGLKPKDIQTPVDLRKLPLLTRDDIRHYFHDLQSTDKSIGERLHGHTSGTTGSPLDLVWDNQICLVKNVVDWRQKRIAGLSPGDRIAFFLGRVVVPLARKTPPFWRHNWIMNHLFCSSYHMSPDNLAAYVTKFKRFRPRAIEGYPSTMYILASYLKSIDQTLPVTAVFTSSETLMPHHRKTIEEAFEAPVFDFYGMAERVVFATECEMHDGKHINMDFSIIEIISKDGVEATAGEMGRIVATGLHNFAMPLIRYQTSDITALMSEPCSCKRSFKRMENITTKDEDIVTTVDGRYISSSILNALTHDLTNIAEHQIIQEDRSHVVVKVVKGETFTDADSNHLLAGLRDTLGDSMEIELEFVDRIPRTKAGKFRWVISKVPLEF